MASNFSYSTLETALKDAVEDQGTDFDGKINELIQRAEDRLLMDLNFEIFDVWSSITFVNGTRTATLPTGFLDVRKLYYTASSSVVWLEERTQDYLLDYWPSTSNTTTTPKFWAPYSETAILIAGTPGATPTTGTANGTKRPDSLVTDTSGTWLSENVGSLLLHACIIEAEKHNLSDERLTMLKAEYGDLLQKAQRQFAHLLRQGFMLGAPTPPATKG